MYGFSVGVLTGAFGCESGRVREVVSSDTACIRAALGIALREYPFGLFRVRSVCHFRKGLKSLHHLFFPSSSSDAAPLLTSGMECPTPLRLLAAVAVSDLFAYSRCGDGEFSMRGMSSLKASGTRIFSIGPEMSSPCSPRGARAGHLRSDVRSL